MAILGDKEYFKGVGEIKFEGKNSDNPMAFKYYNPEQVVAGKTMREHFKLTIAYWHTFCGQGADPFGPGTQNFEWDKSSDPIQASKDKADAAFEFITKMGFDYFCFHEPLLCCMNKWHGMGQTVELAASLLIVRQVASLINI